MRRAFTLIELLVVLVIMGIVYYIMFNPRHDYQEDMTNATKIMIESDMNNVIAMENNFYNIFYTYFTTYKSGYLGCGTGLCVRNSNHIIYGQSYVYPNTIKTPIHVPLSSDNENIHIDKKTCDDGSRGFIAQINFWFNSRSGVHYYYDSCSSSKPYWGDRYGNEI